MMNSKKHVRPWQGTNVFVVPPKFLLSLDNSLMIGNGIRRRSLLESLDNRLFKERNSQMI
ncbi:hypothetical protein [Enterococcus casseliflavus]|uniref:hypothetical protein n=2 Tax=Enterococcus casseliflavus TaxID=37734 RepID=UPI00111410B7|nr:hypothetical protein [Enterococcus casseliflavus]MCD5161161.1 hypothetical protein [Enterococcus casseliflavus]MCD5189782.1 hypothetical protein [Enterococcus casseliflavus]MDT2960585.1 hypothetical protein [Enterococcus casseliflavus]MEB6148508.1 hypothetical protein [Enterococcus casseliflavus]